MNQVAENIADKIIQFLGDDALSLDYGIINDDEIIKVRDNLVEFMKYDGGDDWQDEPHLNILCNKLDQVAKLEIKRLMIFMPPRHGKSQVSSKKFPAYYLGKHPKHCIILTSYSADLALDFSEIARETLRDNRMVFPNVNINPKSSAKAKWSLDGYPEGGLIAAGVGGPITGRGAHIAIIDDPFKNYEEAQSETVRESVWQWYRSTLRTRLAPGGAIVLIMTRWHEDDLAGRLLKEMESGEGEEWEVVSFPGIAQDDDELGRKKGDALSPRFPIDALLETKKAIGSYLFGALYQQHPRPEEGNFFKKNWFVSSGSSVISLIKKWKSENRYYQPYSAMDLAIGEKKVNAFSCIEVGIITPDNEKLLAFVDRFKGDSFEIINHIIDIQRTWNPLLFVFEDENILKAIFPFLLKEAKEGGITINYERLTPINDKVARARPVQGQMRNGQWIFPVDAPWYEDFKEELLGFPNTTYLDQADTFAHLGRIMGDDNPFDGYSLQ